MYSKNIISSGLKAEIDSIATSSKKVEHLLTKIENGLKVEVTEQFEGLLQVMEEYSQKEESAVVKREAIFSPNHMRWESRGLSVNYFNIVSCIIDIRLMIK